MELKESISYIPNSKLMCIDYGLSTIGIALSDLEWKIAFPNTSIKTSKDSLSSIMEIAKNEKIEGFVIGYPLNGDGSKSKLCLQIDDFINSLRDLSQKQCVIFDERYSSIGSRIPMELCNLPMKKQKAHKDKMAACYILQGFLEWNRSITHYCT